LSSLGSQSLGRRARDEKRFMLGIGTPSVSYVVFGTQKLTSFSACRTSREVTDLEEAILKLRTLLRSRAAVVRSLATIEWTEPLVYPKQSEISTGCYTGDDPIVSKLEENARSLPDVLDVLLAERKVDLVLSGLEEGEDMVDTGYACTNFEGGLSPVTPVTAALLQIALSERRARLVTYLSDICQQPSVRGVELRSATAALNRLGEGTRAHTLLLLAHNKRLEHNTRGLRPSGTSYGGAFTAALSQMTFSAISQASSSIWLQQLIWFIV
jgi:hypothetical protein